MSDLSPDQYTWLSVFSGKSLPPPKGVDNKTTASIAFQKFRAGEDRAEIALKAMMLEQATSVVEGEKEKIRAAFTFDTELTDEKTGKTSTVSSKGRQDEALDSREIRQNTKIDESKSSSQKKYFDLIVKEQTKLEEKMVERTEAVDPVTSKRTTKSYALFQKKEIMVGFYTPMVREDVLPENFVPKRFSETQTMLDYSNDEYLSEIKEKGKNLDTGAAKGLQSAIKLAGSVTNAILTATTGVNVKDGVSSLSKVSDVGLDGEWQMRATTITDGIVAVLTTGVDIVDQAVTAYTEVKYDQGAWQTIANSLAIAVGKLVGGGYGNATLGALVTDSLATGIGGVGVGATVIKWAKSHPRGPFPLDQVLGGVASTIGSGLAVGSDQTGGNTSKLFVILGQEVTAGFNIAAKAASKEFGDLVAKGEVGKAFAMLGQTATAEATKAVAGALAGFAYVDKDDELTKKGEESGQTTTDQEKFKDLQKIATTSLKTGETLGKGFDEKALTTINDKLAKDIERATGEKLAKLAQAGKESDAAQSQAEQLAAEKKAYVEALERLTADAPMGDDDFKSIAKLTDQIERDKAIVKMAYNIASIALATPGVAVAKEIVAPLKAAGDLVKFVQNLHAAIERIVALQKWYGSKREATSARSPYLTSIENFIKNNQELLTHNSIQAILLLAKSISGFAETAFPIAKGATVALDLAVTLEDAVFTLYKQRELIKAWEVTERSLDDPNNRKLGLIARGLNPTLAKYSIAYGAVIAKNLTAVSAMSKIGLDRESLMRPGAKSADVKKYLEKLYPDDNIVLGKRDEKKQSLKLPKPELTLKAWTTTFYMWQHPPAPETGKTPFGPVISKNPADILSGLTRADAGAARIEKAFQAVKAAKTIAEEAKAKQALEAEAVQQVKDLQSLEMALRALDPKTEAGSSYDAKYAATGYADLAAAQCTLVAMNIDAKLDQLEAEKLAAALALGAATGLGAGSESQGQEESEDGDEALSELDPTEIDDLDDEEEDDEEDGDTAEEEDEEDRLEKVT